MLKVINISGWEASGIEVLPLNWSLISINDEYVDLHPLKLNRNNERVLTVQFTDLISDVKQNGKIYHTLNQELATKMVCFIKKYKYDNFIVHCHAGVSRSGAVALFIHLTLGHQLKDNFWQVSNPNTQVLGMLIREFYRESNLIF